MTMPTDLFLFFSNSQRISGQSQGRIPEQMGPSWSSKQNFIDITECWIGSISCKTNIKLRDLEISVLSMMGYKV